MPVSFPILVDVSPSNSKTEHLLENILKVNKQANKLKKKKIKIQPTRKKQGMYIEMKSWKKNTYIL